MDTTGSVRIFMPVTGCPEMAMFPGVVPLVALSSIHMCFNDGPIGVEDRVKPDSVYEAARYRGKHL